jgi:hypothetical protein
MKKWIMVAILGVMALGAQAQQSSKRDSTLNEYRNEFILNPLSFFVSGFELGYGAIFPDGFNFRVIGGYYISESAAAYNDKFKNMEGFRVECQYLGLKPVKSSSRYYLGGYANYKQISLEKESSLSPNRFDKLHASAVGFGVLMGIRQYNSGGFFFDFYIGGGPTISVDNTNAEEAHIPIVNPYKRSINPRAGLSIGILF